MLDSASLATLQKLKTKMEESIVKKEGVVKGTEKSYGFLEIEGGESLFIPPVEMKKVLPGDRIIVKVRQDDQGRQQGEPCELLIPYLNRNVARYHYNPKRKISMVYIDSPLYREPIMAKVPNIIREQKPSEGDWVIVELSDHPLKKPGKEPSVIIREIIARKNDPQVPWLVSLRKYDLPTQCPADPEHIELIDKYDRKDLSEIPFITIDSTSTKDIDDAIAIEDCGDHWKLYIAIADPTAYIKLDSPLDQEASKRAFTCYLPGRNIPIIPHVMSEGVCSLMENEVRPVLSATIKVNKDGSLMKDDPCTFTIATIKSHGRLNYDDTSDFLENGSSEKFTPDEMIASELKELALFAQARAEYRSRNTVLFKDRPDYEFILNENGSLKEIKVEYRRTANKIVEECMIIANECAGDFLAEKINTGIFNAHTGFDQEKLEGVIKLINKNQGPDITKEELATMEGYYQVRKFASSQPTGYFDMRLRKFQVPAEIMTNPEPHFGLGLAHYATWTSPIRKYGDMINHRLIKAIISGEDIPQMPNKDIISILNNGKRVNRYAERDTKDWLYGDYLYPEIAKKTVFDTEIVDINRGGMKVVSLLNGATIFIPMSTINPDKDPSIYANNEEGRIFNGDEILFELAMKVKVILTDIDTKNRGLIGELAE